MAKVIIGIHGLGNKPTKQLLEKWWKEAIIEGLTKAGKPYSDFKFELIYWADVLHEKQLDEKCIDKNSPVYLSERYAPSSGKSNNEDHSFRRKMLDILSTELESTFIEKDFTPKYAVVTDAIMKHWFKDLEDYYNEKFLPAFNSNAKKIIRNRVIEVIEKYKDDEILLIAHSMGSIIAFDVLSFEIPGAKIDSLVTIGSPLAAPMVKSKIAAEQKQHLGHLRHLRTPSPLERKWYNFADIEDKVAYNYELADDFAINRHLVKPVDFLVFNDYQINGERNPHKSYGYLRTPEMAAKIREFLEYEPPSVLNRRIQEIKNIMKLLFRTNRNPQNQ